MLSQEYPVPKSKVRTRPISTEASPFDSLASAYDDWFEGAGFSIEKVISTLFQKPGKVERMELPRRGFSPGAGFTVIVARKHASQGLLPGSSN